MHVSRYLLLGSATVSTYRACCVCLVAWFGITAALRQQLMKFNRVHSAVSSKILRRFLCFFFLFFIPCLVLIRQLLLPYSTLTAYSPLTSKQQEFVVVPALLCAVAVVILIIIAIYFKLFLLYILCIFAWHGLKRCRKYWIRPPDHNQIHKQLF